MEQEILNNLPITPHGYEQLLNKLSKLDNKERDAWYRALCRYDLYFLAVFAMKRKDFAHKFLFDRCREVQANPNGHLDLWARDHRKSTLITVMKTIQDILVDPEETFGIFSHTAEIARDFVTQIKRELETNEMLKYLFPDILYANPEKEAPQWSRDGIVVKRKGNPKECTVEPAGIVKGQPIGKHFSVRVYDDIVTKESCSTQEQMDKTKSAWKMSINLGTKDGVARYIGTRYHIHDLYNHLMKEGIAIPRIYPATHDGTPDGEPVYLNKDQLDKKKKDMGGEFSRVL